MKKIAIVIVDCNGHEDTLELLGSAQKLNISDLTLKTVVVDNGSKITLSKSIKTKYKSLGIELLRLDENRGFTGGYNFGMKHATNWGAEYVLIINNDTLFGDKDLLKKLLEAAQSHNKIGMVSPKIYYAKGFEFHKYKKEDKGKVIWYAGGRFDKANVQSVHRGVDEVDHGQYDNTEEIDFVSGCCLLMKTSMLKEIGYFEEKLFAYFEDADLIFRAKRAGYKQYYCGNTYLYHKVSRTAGISSPFSDYLLTRNRLYIGFKYMPLRVKLALVREAIRHLIKGRKEQKIAIKDFLARKTGPPTWIKQNKA